jgi:hypothetical protein
MLTLQRPWTVFISHSSRDADQVKELRESLKYVSGDTEFCISEDFRAGDDWLDKIQEALINSQWMIFVYTNQEYDWTFCTWEVGYYDRLRKEEGEDSCRRVICLTSTGKIPGIVKHKQAVPVLKEPLITSWLKPFFNIVNHALANSDGKLDKKADEIMKILSFNVEEIYHQEKVVLSARLEDVILRRTIPDGALIQGNQAIMQSVFGVAGERASWADIKSLFVDDVYNQWIAELSKAIYEFANRRVFNMQGMIYRSDVEYRYRPVINRIYVQGGILYADIEMVIDVGGRIGRLPRSISALITSLRMAVRFRYEVINRYIGTIEQTSQHDSPRLRADMRQAISNIFIEAQTRGREDLNDLVDAFPIDNKIELEQIASDYNQIHSELFVNLGYRFPEIPNPDTENPLTVEQVEGIKDQLAKLNQINKRFISLLSNRLVEVINRS